MSSDEFGSAWLAASLVAACLAALGVFAGSWFYAARRWDLPGFVVGWLPAAILAFIVAWIAGFGWPLLLPVGVGVWWFTDLRKKYPVIGKVAVGALAVTLLALIGMIVLGLVHDPYSEWRDAPIVSPTGETP